MKSLRTRQIQNYQLPPSSGPVAYGSRRASQFLKDLASTADSLDIVIIGDSNTGSSQSGMWGYHNGFSQAMFELGWLCYGTHYSHLMTDWLVNTNTGGWNSSAFVNQPSGTLFNGNISGGSTAYSTWTPGKVATVTISNASPGVVTYTGHGLTAGAPVFLATTGALPTGLSTGVTYFVKTVLSADTFTVASTPTGSAINTSSAGSGTHTINTCPWTRYGSANATPPAKDSWAYINGAEYWNWYPQIFMTTSHPLYDGSLTLWHRIRWGTFNTGSGYFRPAVRVFGGATLATSAVVNTNTGNANSFQMSEYSFVPTGANQIEAGPVAGGTVAGSRGSVGPVALHGNSIYCKRKGWSVTSHGYLAGYDSLMISQVAITIGLTLQLHLQELRERQISAGGTGRVLIVSHSGINGNETASDWTSSHVSIWNTYKEAWAALGYPSTDLAIVSFVGVPSNSLDNSNNGTGSNLVAVRAAANALSNTQPDMTIIDVKAMMPYTRAIVGVGNGRSYYQRTNNLPNAGSDITVHLSGGIYTGSTKDTSDGYTVMAHEIIQTLLNNA